MYGLSDDAKENSTMRMMTWLMPSMMLVFSFQLQHYLYIGFLVIFIQHYKLLLLKNHLREKDNQDNVIKAKYKEVK